jgi:hypothetical protein
MSTTRADRFVSRRTALAGMGAGGIGFTLGARSSRAAQATSTADHPLMGMWLAMANPARRGQDPQFPAPSLFAADGTVILGFVPAEIGMEGELQYTGSPMGVWEPYDEQTGHFTAVQVLADKTGKLIGTVTIDGHPKVSADGTSFIDDGSLVTVTIRDPAGSVIAVIPPSTGGPPVTAIRMQVGLPGFPGEEDATPVP